MITTDDLAALVVLADRAAPFQHHLRSDYMSLRWVLDRDTDGTARPSLADRVAGPTSSPAASRKQRHATDDAVGSAASPSSSSSAERRQQSATDGDGNGDGAGANFRDEGTPHKGTRHDATSAAGDSASATPTHSPSRTNEAAMSLPPPPPLLGLRDLDVTKSVEDYPKTATALITTPRSALTLLRSGFGVADVLGVPRKAILNRALLDGASKEAVQMRLAADKHRRELRRGMVMQQYDDLCAQAPRGDVVEAMRAQFFAIAREDRHNATTTAAALNPIVPVAGATKALLDEDCVEALSKARDRAAAEMSRVVDQTERQRQRALRKEEALFEQQAALAGEAKQSNVHRDRILAARRAAAQQKLEHARERSLQLQAAEQAKTEQRRAELMEKRDVSDDRALHSRTLSRKATKALVKVVEERREVVRRTEKELLEQRRDGLEAKAQFKVLLHDRAMAERERAMAERRAEAEQRERERRAHLRETAQREAERKEREHDELRAVADRRAREIEEARLERRAAKRARAAARAERLEATQLTREQQEQLRLAERDALIEEKDAGIAKAEAERRRAILEANERKAIARLERGEEQRRAQSVSEFRYVGYVSGTHHKSSWIEREAGKRRVLGLQVRQEREAIRRSRDEMLQEIEARDQQQRRRIELQFR